MKEIRSIIKQYDAIKAAEKKMALATVVYVAGSSYRREGARMLVVEDGTWIGGISGGCLEGDALRKAKNAMIQAKPSIVRYDTREEDAFQIGVGLGCNGIIDVLIAPIDVSSYNAIEVLRKCADERKSNVLLTVVKSPNEDVTVGTMVKYMDEKSLALVDSNDLIQLLSTDISSALNSSESGIKSYNINSKEWSFFIEVLPPEIHLILYGGNYDIYPLVDIAKDVGWNVTVVCNPQKVVKSIISKADNVLSNRAFNSKNKVKLNFDTYSAAILMAHDYITDMKNLEYLLDKPISYIGMLGPQIRSKKIIDELSAKGIEIDADQMKKIHAPVGLDTGATSPEEIAISIIAEIRTSFARRKGGMLKTRQDTIHIRSKTESNNSH